MSSAKIKITFKCEPLNTGGLVSFGFGGGSGKRFDLWQARLKKIKNAVKKNAQCFIKEKKLSLLICMILVILWVITIVTFYTMQQIKGLFVLLFNEMQIYLKKKQS